MTPSERIIQELIEYNLQILKARKDAWVKSNPHTAPDELPLIPRTDIDALQKMFMTIKNKEIEWREWVQMVTQLLEFLETKSPEHAAILAALTDEFLQMQK
jgi:hypothetical protein